MASPRAGIIAKRAGLAVARQTLCARCIARHDRHLISHSLPAALRFPLDTGYIRPNITNQLNDDRERSGDNRPVKTLLPRVHRWRDCRVEPRSGPQGSAGAAPAAPAAGCTSGKEFLATDCPLTWHGITLYGTYDVGVGWVSHGLPENGVNYEGEALVNRNGNHSQFLIAPEQPVADGTGRAGQGGVSARLVRGVQRLDRHQSAVRPARQHGWRPTPSTTASPGAATPIAGDGARAGQTFNDEFIGGVVLGALRHADPRPPARARYRRDAAATIRPAAPTPSRSSATTA